jgi:hypothetical protein
LTACGAAFIPHIAPLSPTLPHFGPFRQYFLR